jgi:RND superfamily putative drug exporter
MTVVRGDDERTDASGAAAHGAGPHPRRWLWPVVGIALFLVAGGPLAGLAGNISTVQKNDSASYLPANAEATRVLAEQTKFAGSDTLPAIIVYSRPSGITEEDRNNMTLDTLSMPPQLGTKLAGPPMGPIVSDDGKAAETIVLFSSADAERFREDIDWLRELSGGHPGLEAHVTGPAGIYADLIEVFSEIDGVLVLVTALVILVILIAVYRSPILPFVVLGVAGMALGMANGLAYLLGKHGVITVSGESQGILDVLVLGAATDYALLLVSRFREELRRHRSPYEAMRVAWRASVQPIVASAGTVILGLLCLLASDLNSTRGLGPIGAMGIGFALISMLGLLPLVMVVLGRVAFWPFRPAYGSRPAEEHGVWARVSAAVGRRPRVIWVTTALILGVLVLGVLRLQAAGVPQSEAFTAKTDSRTGQAIVGQHFQAGSGNPAVIFAKADKLPEVLAAIATVTPNEAKVVPDYFATVPKGAKLPNQVVDGRVQIQVTFDLAPDSAQATTVIRDLRRAVHAVPGADGTVGGFSAINLDIRDTALRDRYVIIPIVLVVVFLILMLLLRAVVAPLLLMATVVLSFLATLGVCGFVFRDLIGFPGADAGFPLFAFVFLVALGIDYNIFLMTRVREEVRRRGHRDGTLAGLAVTGGVITSAGAVLAATFAALAVLPLVFLAELAFAVSFGVLLDALVVRSLLVPALTVDVGRVVWWPSRLGLASPPTPGSAAGGVDPPEPDVVDPGGRAEQGGGGGE